MREGYTLVAVGWEFDVPKAKDKNLIGFDAPIATDNGQPITGWISPWFIPRQALRTRTNTLPDTTRPPIRRSIPTIPLPADRVREGWVATQRLIPREDWQFGRDGKWQGRVQSELADAERRLQGRHDLSIHL